ncbi:hypothetical protein [Massilia phyllosphaerae]|uniref:hypothetical protein n=1 Tax=Massilia phyllosphaerae TaxID=3106034 RepID=UPI002B1CCFC2|nr:hypothetical protein [Massilia sp. SGZ-792]
MTKHSKTAPKSPITQEAVCRMQSSTAPNNGGRQSDYVARLQSVADKRAAEGGAGAPAGQRQGSRKTA